MTCIPVLCILGPSECVCNKQLNVMVVLKETITAKSKIIRLH